MARCRPARAGRADGSDARHGSGPTNGRRQEMPIGSAVSQVGSSRMNGMRFGTRRCIETEVERRLGANRWALTASAHVDRLARRRDVSPPRVPFRIAARPTGRVLLRPTPGRCVGTAGRRYIAAASCSAPARSRRYGRVSNASRISASSRGHGDAPAGADGVALDDHVIGSERAKARREEPRLLYAIDRTIAGGTSRSRSPRR